METLSVELERALTAAIEQSFGSDLAPEETHADISPCAQEEFGHYQCNSALRLGKRLSKNPRLIAQILIDSLNTTARLCFSKIEIAGPGFINFTFHPAFLSETLNLLLTDPLLGAMPPKRKERILVEFSSPNVAKELHVGHLRSTIIGEALARLFEFLGHDVLRLNHIGDWGTQFGMLIAYLKATHLFSFSNLTELMHCYREAKKRFDHDPEFKKQAQLEVIHLQAKDPDSLNLWQKICDISRKGFQEIYDLLNVHLTERGESFYNPELKKIVEELEKKGLVTLSEGAKCIFLDGFELPLMIQKADGGYNYDTTDMAAIRQRIFVEKADRIIYVVDAGQSLHFQMVFSAAEKAGWLNPSKTRAEHVAFGLVLGNDGKKFKTRSGDTEKLIDLLLEAIERARAILLERGTPGGEVDSTARILGIDAVKYADLSCHRTKDYTFSYDRMLRFDGNTAVFLLYSYVRVLGIKRKIGIFHPSGKIDLSHPSEISLALHLRRFGEVIEMMSRELLPHRLTDYLYTLAEKFNAFFRDCRVEGSPEQTSRLLLCEATERVLYQGLEILGLKTVEKL